MKNGSLETNFQIPRRRIDALCTREELYKTPFARWIIKRFLRKTKAVTWRGNIKLFSINDFIKYLEYNHGLFIHPHFFKVFFGHPYSNVFRRERYDERMERYVYTIVATYPGITMNGILRCLVGCEVYKYKHRMMLSPWAEELLFDLEDLREEVYAAVSYLLKIFAIEKEFKPLATRVYIHLHENGRYFAKKEYVVDQELYHILRLVHIPTQMDHEKNLDIIDGLVAVKVRVPKKIRKLDESKKSLTPKEKLARRMGRRVGFSHKRFTNKAARERKRNT